VAESIDQLLDRAAALLESGRKVALCLLVGTKGSTPASPGAMMLVDDAAELYGTVGGGCVEAEVRRRVFEMMGSDRTGLLQFNLDHDYGWDDGLICGGAIDVAVALPADGRPLRAVAEAYRRREPTELSVVVDPGEGVGGGGGGDRQRYVLALLPRPQLLIAGAGHVGQAVCRLALDLDFDVAVFDDRHDLLERYIPDPARRVAGPMHETMAQQPIDGGTYIVIVTRGHRHDEQVLGAVAEQPARYIGMIGSRRKVKLTFDELRAAGVSEEALQRVRAPIGLDIGSVTVNEVALAIAAQLVEARRADYRSPVQGPLAADAAPA
jgi:xanthine dehydrogenase accessory factor